MAWIKLDDGFPEHRKVIEVGGDAGWLHVCALAYCNRNLTDGHIPSKALARLSDRRTPAKLAGRLVECGLWLVAEDGDGWVIHDYLTYQPSRAEVEKRRADARERMASARSGSQNVHANNERSSHNPVPVPSRSRPESSSSSPELTLVRTDPPEEDDPVSRILDAITSTRVAEQGKTGHRGYMRTVRADVERLRPGITAMLTDRPDLADVEPATAACMFTRSPWEAKYA